MLDTRLLLVEGLAGSGKSSTVMHLTRLLRRRGHDALAVREEDEHRPFIDEFPNFVQDFPGLMLHEWQLLVEESKRNHRTYLMEGHGWQPMAEYMFMAGYSRRDVLEFCRAVAHVIRPLKPVVIYYAHEDLEAHINRVAITRGGDWIRLVEDRDTRYHGLGRFGGSLLQFWREWSHVQDEIFSRWPLPKVRIQASYDDWEATYMKVRAFLQLW